MTDLKNLNPLVFQFRLSNTKCFPTTLAAMTYDRSGNSNSSHSTYNGGGALPSPETNNNRLNLPFETYNEKLSINCSS